MRQFFTRRGCVPFGVSQLSHGRRGFSPGYYQRGGLGKDSVNSRGDFCERS